MDNSNSALWDDQTTLLLYLLIHRNADMKAFIFSRTNIDSLVRLSKGSEGRSDHTPAVPAYTQKRRHEGFHILQNQHRQPGNVN